MMRRRAGLDTNETRRQLLEEGNDVTALQLAPDDHIAFGVNAMDLKNRLCDVETNRRDSLHGPVLRIRSPPWRPRSVALTCRWRSRPQHQERSFDHLIGAGDEGREDVEADRGRGFEIDDQLEFGGQLDRQIGRPGAVEDAVDVTRRALEQDTEIGALGNEPAGRNVFSIWVDGRQSA